MSRLCIICGQNTVFSWLKPPHHHNRFTALFQGPSEWADARRELLDFMVQGKINRGRHTDHPAGRHSIWTNQCTPPPSPIFLQARCTSCHPTNSIKALKAKSAELFGIDWQYFLQDLSCTHFGALLMVYWIYTWLTCCHSRQLTTSLVKTVHALQNTFNNCIQTESRLSSLLDTCHQFCLFSCTSFVHNCTYSMHIAAVFLLGVFS